MLAIARALGLSKWRPERVSSRPFSLRQTCPPALPSRPGRAKPGMYPIDHLYRGWRRRPDALAIEDGVRGLTYAELVARVEALAAELQARFPAPQARIGICGYNTIEHVIAILAVYAAGHTWVALNPRNGKPELDAIVGSTRLDLIIADENCLDRFTVPEVLRPWMSGVDIIK